MEDNFITQTLNAAVCDYLIKNPILTIKICVLGKFGVGKTSLIRNYIKVKREQLSKMIKSEYYSNKSLSNSFKSHNTPMNKVSKTFEIFSDSVTCEKV